MTDVHVTFKHPTDSTSVRRATLSTDITPAFILGKLVEDGFVPTPAPGAPYSLVTDRGDRLDPDATLHAAGIAGDTTLAVTPEHQGAAPYRAVTPDPGPNRSLA